MLEEMNTIITIRQIRLYIFSKQQKLMFKTVLFYCYYNNIFILGISNGIFEGKGSL